MNKELTVNIVMSNYSGGDEGGGLHIEIQDTNSRLRIADIRISGDENIANFFRTRSCQGKAEVFDITDPRYGLKEEVITYVSPVDAKDSVGANEACDEAERRNPGWTADSKCRKSYNYHKRGPYGYTVTLRRWVTPKAIIGNFDR